MGNSLVAFSKDHQLWNLGIRAITTEQLHSAKSELKRCAGSNPALHVQKVKTSQWSQLIIIRTFQFDQSFCKDNM